MVKRSLLMLLSLVIAGGCQSTNQQVSMLPPPTFDGPKVDRPAPAPVVVHRPVSTPKPSVIRETLPTGWKPPVAARPWQYIVIHHSATGTGGAKAFDRMHRDRGWDELGYHFVIGNGTDTGDGVVEVGSRWVKQKYGAHCKTPDNRYNDFGIGICLVGDFDKSNPSPAQMRELAKLTSYLMKTYNIPPNRVIGHGDAKPTECPGRNLNVAVVRRMATQMLAESGANGEPDVRVAGGELLVDSPSQP